MTVNMMSPTKKAGGCGCGGSGGRTAVSSCTCGSAPCATCLDQGYTRPRFFAGQLLTEEDLQLLGDYVIGKNRLHNRYLMGSGVVCGLQVTCQPCERGDVVVNPGYAIDCCGNDIVVSCPQELDINKMVHDLQVKLRGGYDCGDPCAKSGSYATDSSTTAGNNGNGAKGGGSAIDTTSKPHCHKYCLYVDYCEQDTEPVAPYATDEPCGPTICEPSRVREGFRFELRCPEEDEPAPALCARLWDCWGDKASLDKTTSDADFLRPKAPRFVAAAEELRKNPTPKIGKAADYLEQLNNHYESLGKVFEGFKSTATVTQAMLTPLLDNCVAVAGDIALFKLQSPPDQRSISDEGKSLLDRVRKLLLSACDSITKQIGEASLTPLESAYDNAVVSMISKLYSVPPKPALEAEVAAEDFGRLMETSVLVLAHRVVLNAELYNKYAESLDAMQYWLQRQTRHPQNSTHCDLQAKVTKAPVPAPVADDLRIIHVSTLGESSMILTESVNTVLCSCICDALNPPCPSCDDPGVLLACLTVEDCKVKDICNLDRDFVLSPVAIRYWLPQIQWLGEAVEKWCCPCPCPEEESDTTDDRFLSLVNRREMLSCRELYFIMQRYFCPRQDKAVKELAAAPTAVHSLFPPIAERLHEVVSGGAAVASRTEVEDLQSKLDETIRELQALRAEQKKASDKINRVEKKLKEA